MTTSPSKAAARTLAPSRAGGIRSAWIAERTWLLLWSAAAMVVGPVGLGGFVEWDESVFHSQSGGLGGANPSARTSDLRGIRS